MPAEWVGWGRRGIEEIPQLNGHKNGQVTVCTYRQMVAFGRHAAVRLFFLVLDCWTAWTSWTDCGGECGYRMSPRTRNRTCLTPLTTFGTDCCPGDSYQEITCDPRWGSKDCPVGKKTDVI